jgi:hypothetical protein
LRRRRLAGEGQAAAGFLLPVVASGDGEQGDEALAARRRTTAGVGMPDAEDSEPMLLSSLFEKVFLRIPLGFGCLLKKKNEDETVIKHIKRMSSRTVHPH